MTSGIVDEPTADQFQESCRTLVKATQKMLKDNWKIVKRGEGFYRATKVVTASVAAVGILFLYGWGLYVFLHPAPPDHIGAKAGVHP